MNTEHSIRPATAARSHDVARTWTEALVAFTAADTTLDAAARRAQGLADGPELALADAATDALAGLRNAAYDALLATPPSDAAGLALKMRLHAKECDDDRLGYDDPAYVQDECWAGFAAKGAAQFYQDALGLARAA